MQKLYSVTFQVLKRSPLIDSTVCIGNITAAAVLHNETAFDEATAKPNPRAETVRLGVVK